MTISHPSDIESEWSLDAFEIPPAILMRQCKEWARRQQREAVMFGQPYDVTAERMLALYHRLRGRCAVLFYPLTITKGPFKAELHHWEPVNRGDCVRQRCAGKNTRYGLVGMMSNITLVSRAGHMLLHWANQYGIPVEELAMRSSVFSKLGSPLNPSISFETAKDFYATQENVDAEIRKMADCSRFIPSVGDIFDALRKSGLHVKRSQIVDSLTLMGIDTRSYMQKQRVAICSDLVRVATEASPNRDAERIKSFVVARAPGEYIANGMRVPSPKQMSDDAKVAIKQVLGIDLFRAVSVSDGYHQRKSQIWTRPTPARLNRVYQSIKKHGKAGVLVQSVCCELLAKDPMRHVESYRNVASSGVLRMIDDLHNRRLVDLRQDTVTARLLVSDAATYCGYTANTFRQFCKGAKGVMGPASEMACPGKGHALSFAFSDLDDFLQTRSSCRRLVHGI